MKKAIVIELKLISNPFSVSFSDKMQKLPVIYVSRNSPSRNSPSRISRNSPSSYIKSILHQKQHGIDVKSELFHDAFQFIPGAIY